MSETQFLAGFATGTEIAVPCDRIDASLDDLWRRHAAKVAQGRGEPVHRACLVNLVVHAGDSGSEVVAGYLAMALADRVPARVFVLRMRPDDPGEGAPSAWISALRSPERDAQSSRVAGEIVTVAASGAQTGRVPALLRAALVPDLATTLWWTGPMPRGCSTTAALLDLADRVLLDSDAIPDDQDVTHLLGVAGRAEVADLAWPRLASWRTAICRAFDGAASRGILESAAEVEFVMPGVGGRGAAEMSSAPLLAGWLAESLGWTDDVHTLRRRDGTPVRVFVSGGGRRIDEVLVRDAAGRSASARCETRAPFDPVETLASSILSARADPIAPAAIRRAARIGGLLRRS